MPGWLVVGLGNPGAKYEGTPHNVGFQVAEAVAARWDLGKLRPRYAGRFAQARDRAVLLPQTFMNESGRCVGPARGALRVELDHLIVCHDELDLAFADVRAKFGGGLAGHNGLKSIKAALGSPDFHRVRIGIGRPDTTDPEVVSRYVLGRWRQPKADVDALVDEAVATVEAILEEPRGAS